MVPKAASELKPKRVIDTATASSKKFEAAIIEAGKEIEYFFKYVCFNLKFIEG